MKQMIPWAVLAAILIGLVGLLCAIFRPNGDIAAFIQHPATTAWFQAIGSVLAVAVAVWVSARHASLQREEREAAMGDFVNLVLGLASQAKHLVEDCERQVESGQITIEPRNIDTVIHSLDRLPMDRMPSSEFALAFVNVRRTLYFFGPAYKATCPRKPAGPKVASAAQRKEVAKRARDVVQQYERLVSAAKTLAGVEPATQPEDGHPKEVRTALENQPAPESDSHF